MSNRHHRRFLFLALLLVVVTPSLAQYSVDTASVRRDGHRDLRHDLQLGLDPFAPSPSDEVSLSDERSPWIAGGLSALVPGAGQLYAEAPLWRALLYGAIEVGGWTAYALYSSKGDEATAEFERYAEQHWDLGRYVDWIAANYQRWPDGSVDRAAIESALEGIYTSNDPTIPSWQRIDWEQLRRLEKGVKQGFSHTLPGHGEQQYYEEIGKYVQYRAGWSDHATASDTTIYDPGFVTERNRRYMEMRAEANDLLGYAGTALGVVIVNHLASMIDAGLAARSYNVSVRAKIEGRLDRWPREQTPMLELSIRF